MKKNQDYIKKTLFSIVFLVIILLISRNFYTRFDLTTDKRYTLSQTTLKTLQKIQSPVTIDVLFTENIPNQYKRLQQEVIQLLEEYQSENKLISIKYSNPLKDDENSEKTLQELLNYGIFPLQITEKQEGTTSQQYIFPWAIVNSGEKSEKVSLFKNKLGANDQERVQVSVQNLEYAFTDAIHKILLKKEKKIAILRGNGTLSDIQMADFLRLQGDYYRIAPFTLDSVSKNPIKTFEQLTDFNLLIVPKPTERFSDEQKFVLDQYVMHGGAVLWLLDAVHSEIEELFENQGEMVAMPMDLNLGDLFFKYGFRINYDLINDLYFTQIVVAQGEGSQTNYMPIPWVYNPMLLSKENHLINKNLDAIRLQFANSIDTLKNGIKKHILLASSPLSKQDGAPRTIQLKISKDQMDKNNYKTGNFITGLLLEGNFTSVFKNRVKPFDLQGNKDEGNASKMIVISDGDIIKNDISKGEPMELGYDKWTNNFYDNKLFLQNCVNYLLNDADFLQLRNKKVKLSFLDQKKVADEKSFWQFFTIIFPIFLVSILAILAHFWYKKEFSK